MTAYDDVIAACLPANQKVSEAWEAYQESTRKVSRSRKLHLWALKETVKHIVISRVEIINAKNLLRRAR